MKEIIKEKSFEDSTNKEFTVLNDIFDNLEQIISNKDQILELGILSDEEIDSLGRIKEGVGFTLYWRFFKLI